MTAQQIDVSLKKVLKSQHMTLEVKVRTKGAKAWKVRLFFARFLCALAARIVWSEFRFLSLPSSKPWLYHCPNCFKETNGIKPNDGDCHIGLCSHCNNQFLAIGQDDQPRIIAGSHDLDCGYGCHWTSPFGFVPECGCPVHDKDETFEAIIESICDPQSQPHNWVGDKESLRKHILLYVS